MHILLFDAKNLFSSFRIKFVVSCINKNIYLLSFHLISYCANRFITVLWTNFTYVCISYVYCIVDISCWFVFSFHWNYCTILQSIWYVFITDLLMRRFVTLSHNFQQLKNPQKKMSFIFRFCTLKKKKTYIDCKLQD